MFRRTAILRVTCRLRALSFGASGAHPPCSGRGGLVRRRKRGAFAPATKILPIARGVRVADHERLSRRRVAPRGECRVRWNLSKGYRNGAPDFSLQFKATRKVSETVALGAEYYSSSGQRRTSFPRQSKATRSSPSPTSNSRAGA